jgi:hypothetical protein
VAAQELQPKFELASLQGASTDITDLTAEALEVELNAGRLTTRRVVLQFMERIQRLDHSGPYSSLRHADQSECFEACR